MRKPVIVLLVATACIAGVTTARASGGHTVIAAPSVAGTAPGNPVSTPEDLFHALTLLVRMGDDGTFSAGTNRFLSFTHTETGLYTLLADADVRGCVLQARPPHPRLYASATVSGTNGVAVRVWAVSTSGAHSEFPVDAGFEASVTC